MTSADIPQTQIEDRGNIPEIVEFLGRCSQQQPRDYWFHLNTQTNNKDDSTKNGSADRRARIFVLLCRDGGAGMRREYEIVKLPGRSGWVYLIHAQDTKRYKIGRSNNPVARHQTLQNQSPYSLEIINSFWSVDAINDETHLHDEYGQYRVHGEWFEFDLAVRTSNMDLQHLKIHFEHPQWARELARESFRDLADKSFFDYGDRRSVLCGRDMQTIVDTLSQLYVTCTSVNQVINISNRFDTLANFLTREDYPPVSLYQIGLQLKAAMMGFGIALDEGR